MVSSFQQDIEREKEKENILFFYNIFKNTWFSVSVIIKFYFFEDNISCDTP